MGVVNQETNLKGKRERERRETHVVFGSWESSGKEYGTIAAISI